jgi:hypothetical protein
MSGILALSNQLLFTVGTLVFLAVFAAALSLAYLRFAEIGEERGGPPIEDEEAPPRAG